MDSYDVFISYQHYAKKIVDYLVENLERSGISCWYAPRNLIGGQEYDEAITKVISNARCVIAVISDEALESQWIKREIVLADDYNIPIISFEIAPISIQKGLTEMLAIKEKIVAYENPSRSIKNLIEAINNISSKKEKKSSGANVELSNDTGVKGRYSILQNAKGGIMIMLNAREGGPEHPRLIYDGKDTALFYRNPNSSVALPNIDEEARNPLKSAEEVLVVEIANDEVVREFVVPVRLVLDVNSLIIK